VTLTYGEVADILKIVEASSLDEVVLELGGTKLVVRRGGSGGAIAPASVSATVPAARAAQAAATTAAPASAPSAVVATASGQKAGTEIRAPMVGTFYRKPSPNDPVFVEVGSRVKAGDPLCLIEVMKLYNTIAAPVAGTVAAILADDAALVAFDQVLIQITPD